MAREQEKSINNVPQDYTKNIESLKNIEDTLYELKLSDLIKPVVATNKQISAITELVFSEYRNVFELNEIRFLKLNHYELYELTYKIVESVVEEIQRVKVNKADELLNFDLNTIGLFMEPKELSPEEISWVDKKVYSIKNEEIEIQFRIPRTALKNLYINLKRIVKSNSSNPDFYKSIFRLLNSN
jgi:hypothetical protein